MLRWKSSNPVFSQEAPSVVMNMIFNVQGELFCITCLSGFFTSYGYDVDLPWCSLRKKKNQQNPSYFMSNLGKQIIKHQIE